MYNIWDKFDFGNSQHGVDAQGISIFEAHKDLWLKLADSISEQSAKSQIETIGCGTIAMASDTLKAMLENN